MRILAMMAFVALQCSILACGFDIHVHTSNADLGHIAEHLHEGGEPHQGADFDTHGCHLHASHTADLPDAGVSVTVADSPLARHFALEAFTFRRLRTSIDYPPESVSI